MNRPKFSPNALFCGWLRLLAGFGWLVACCGSAKPRPIEDFRTTAIHHQAKPNGLIVDVISKGQGRSTNINELVRVHYITTLENGTVIDSSHSRKPLLIRLGNDSNFIEGLHQGLSDMKVGELRRVQVPPRLGYRGQKLAKIPPNVDLVLYLELMEIIGQ